MPNLGTPIKIIPILMNRPQIPLKNVTLVRPRPFSTLLNVVLRYKNGQIHASVLIKLPASWLEKTKFPRKSPKMMKKSRQEKPKNKQNRNVLFKIFFKAVVRPCAWDSDTLGSSIREMEPVKALGNKIKGSAIPVKIPYTLNAVSGVIP